MRLSRLSRLLALAGACGIAAGAQAQYATDFEAVTASATGEVQTGQDGYYIPAGTTSVDYLAYTYAGNPYSFPANPDGGANFIAGEGPAGGAFARAQRDITWPSGTVKVTFDVAGAYVGGATPANNLGSFSMQPSTGAAAVIFLMAWSDTAAQTWRLGYNAFDAAGTAIPAPGVVPGPEWENLPLLSWYRFTTTIDFGANAITEASVTDLATGVTTTVPLTDAYLAGGAAGGLPAPTAFRFFGGGSAAGNVTAWDNLTIEQIDAGCYADCDGNGILDFFDFLCFQNAFATGDPYADCDGNSILDFFDFLCFQNEFAVGCP
ncbi:MAG: hypothetical protein ACF8R7_03720 [Phycisphaerales bacterium JB039]